MSTTAIETITVPEAAKLIAAEIREKGHYYSGKLNDHPSGACLVLNSVFERLQSSVARDFIAEIIDRAKMTEAMPDASYPARTRAVLWNDRAGTEQVLEVLDAIAASAH